MKISGIVSVIIGIVYIVKPNLFRRGIWMKTDIAIRKLSPEGYVKYMRGLGIVFIVIGLLFLAFGK